jgi:hypothetical protein
MRIAHRYRDTANGSIRKVDFHFGADPRLSHRRAKLKILFIPTREIAGLDSCPSSDRHGHDGMFRAVPRRYAARAVARNLRLRTICVEQANGDIGIASREYPFDAISANAVVPVADPLAESSNVCGSVFDCNNQKIVTAGASFDERDGGHIS